MARALVDDRTATNGGLGATAKLAGSDPKPKVVKAVAVPAASLQLTVTPSPPPPPPVQWQPPVAPVVPPVSQPPVAAFVPKPPPVIERAPVVNVQPEVLTQSEPMGNFISKGVAKLSNKVLDNAYDRTEKYIAKKTGDSALASSMRKDTKYLQDTNPAVVNAMKQVNRIGTAAATIALVGGAVVAAPALGIGGAGAGAAGAGAGTVGAGAAAGGTGVAGALSAAAAAAGAIQKLGSPTPKQTLPENFEANNNAKTTDENTASGGGALGIAAALAALFFFK